MPSSAGAQCRRTVSMSRTRAVATDHHWALASAARRCRSSVSAPCCSTASCVLNIRGLRMGSGWRCCRRTRCLSTSLLVDLGHDSRRGRGDSVPLRKTFQRQLPLPRFNGLGRCRVSRRGGFVDESMLNRAVRLERRAVTWPTMREVLHGRGGNVSIPRIPPFIETDGVSAKVPQLIRQISRITFLDQRI